ncbi:group III truncated hemoglobin [Streptomyces sp. NPDC005722]
MSAPGPVAAQDGTGRDLVDRADVERLVTAFYRRAFADPLEVARMDLDAHMPIMCDFWESVLFAAGRYRRNALAPHQALHRMTPLGPDHFGRWLALWGTTVDELFRGEKAELAKLQAGRIGGSLQRRLAGRAASEYVTIRRREGGEGL